MGPSRHSSSSHSSRSSSSSRSSARHSSSSRSFSSRSSYSSPSSRSSSFRGPSRHSSSSRNSIPISPYNKSSRQFYRPVNPTEPPRRPRVNQPIGFLLYSNLKPKYYYGKQHDYVYYPESWTDQGSGITYQKGYYDENGQYYADVSFTKNGRYENVICNCPYCGQNTILNLTSDDISAHHLQCPHCGGPMTIRSELDEYFRQPAENTHVYKSEKSLRQFTGRAKKKKSHRWWIIGFLLLICYAIGSVAEDSYDSNYFQEQTAQQFYENSELNSGFGSEIYLMSSGRNAYQYVKSADQSCDKRLVWDSAADSYYDASTDCWLWYNTEVEPPIWQYWYEGISSDYGDYGWMEHDFSGWYIEKSQDNWTRLPSQYDTDRLWYIAD